VFEDEMEEEEDDDDSDDSDKDDEPPLHVFFDIEAMQTREKHEANLLVAEMENEDESFAFKGEHYFEQFFMWLDDRAQEGRQMNLLAHNFQGYDGYFAANEYCKQNRIIEQIRNGAKLLQVKHNTIRFIDSLSFFQMPLSAFPKTFGLTELKKGYFPHLFNNPERQNCVGLIPGQDYYMPESMTPKDRKAFAEWYRKQQDQNVEFDFQQELLAYCESDVRL